jgi:hypothetical protein
LNGWWKVVETVAISPAFDVSWLSAATKISGSCAPIVPWAPKTSRSGTKRASMRAASARWATILAVSRVERSGSSANSYGPGLPPAPVTVARVRLAMVPTSHDLATRQIL